MEDSSDVTVMAATSDDEQLRSFRDKIRIFEEFSARPPTNNSRLPFGLFRKRQQASKPSPGESVSTKNRSKKPHDLSTMNSWHSTPTLDERQSATIDIEQDETTEDNGDVTKKPHWTVRLTNRLHRIRQVFEQKRGNATPPSSHRVCVASSRLSLVSVFPDIDIEDGVSKDITASTDTLPSRSVPEDQADCDTSKSTTKSKKVTGSERGSFIAELLLKFSQGGGNSAAVNGKKDPFWTIKNKKKPTAVLPSTEQQQQSSTYIEADRIDSEVPTVDNSHLMTGSNDHTTTADCHQQPLQHNGHTTDNQ